MEWCPVCCTQHVTRSDCPGELLATGPERHGRRITVAANARNETYGVLIAEAGDLWRARVLTYPNMLWSVPGGKGTVKFVGDSPRNVERQAVAFIERMCKARGYKVVEQAAELESAKVTDESADSESPRQGKDARHLRVHEVHFGAEKAEKKATTGDLSRGGMFVATSEPLAAGSALRLRLELEGFSIPLVGTVAWARRRAEEGRPAGMGVNLHNPPALYTRFVREIERGSAGPAAGGDHANREAGG